VFSKAWRKYDKRWGTVKLLMQTHSNTLVKNAQLIKKQD